MQYRTSVLFVVAESERPALEQDPRFFLPAYYGAYGWLGLDLDAADVDWQEVAELVDVELPRGVRAAAGAAARRARVAGGPLGGRVSRVGCPDREREGLRCRRTSCRIRPRAAGRAAGGRSPGWCWPCVLGVTGLVVVAGAVLFMVAINSWADNK